MTEICGNEVIKSLPACTIDGEVERERERATARERELQIVRRERETKRTLYIFMCCSKHKLQ